MRVPILNYHLVRDDLLSGDLIISKNKLEEQIQCLQNWGYTSISLQDLLDCKESPQLLPKQPVILTFDDGFADCYQNAWPLLSKYRVRFTVFLVSKMVGKENNWAGIFSGKLKLLERPQILEMLRSGTSFGAHSCSHSSLIHLSPDELRNEVNGSKEQISEMTGEEVHFFAYPYGEFNSRVRDEVERCGYFAACTTLQGVNTRKTENFQLRRIPVSGTDTITDFYFKLKYGFGLLSYSNLKGACNYLFREKKILNAYEKTASLHLRV